MRKNSFKTKFFLTIISLSVSLLFAEIFLRLFMPKIGLAPVKDQSITWASPEYQQFNPTIKKKKPCLLFLGDSYLAGDGVSSLEERFPIVFQQNNPNLSVQILATGGWGTDQQLLAFLEKGKAYKPDLVALAFCAGNDLANILTNRHGPVTGKNYFSVDKNNSLTFHNSIGKKIKLPQPKLYSQKIMRSYLVNLIRYNFYQYSTQTNKNFKINKDIRYTEKIEKWHQTKEIYELKETLSWSPQNKWNSHVSAYIHEDFKTNVYKWKLLKAVLKKLHQECISIKAKLVVILLPVTYKAASIEFVTGSDLKYQFKTSEGSFTFNTSEPNKRLKHICKNLNIEWFDPTKKIIKKVKEKNIIEHCYPKEDAHFSAVVHQMLAIEWDIYLKANAHLLKEQK